MVSVQAIDHVGIRVTDSARAERFYAHLGFEVATRFEQFAVVILKHPNGIELNLIANADPASSTNVLMDEAGPKRPGITHLAFAVADVATTLAALDMAGIAIAEGPVPLGDGQSIFVRDPDRNVIELRAPR